MKPNYQHSRIYAALPALDEYSYLKEVINCVKSQTYTNFELIVCVNQPEGWWLDSEHKSACQNNQESIKWLLNQDEVNLTLIDKSSKGKGWEKKKSGVGWARKTLMDFIVDKAKDDDIILSLDADTVFNPNYFQSIVDNFKSNPKLVAVSVPYYHPLTEDEDTNRHILRYEFYMRYYALNLWRIKNPYNFSALGSAIAVPIWAYKRVGGISPHKSGEDFYFLLKLRKFGKLGLWNSEKVFPAARYSDRVFFGTGPAMIKGAAGDWSSYPIYDFRIFDEIEMTYSLFEKLYKENLDFPMKAFLSNLFKDEKWFEPLRKNSSSFKHFIKACYDKVDALRILQYLKFRQKQSEFSDEEMLRKFLLKFHLLNENAEMLEILDPSWTFEKANVDDLNSLRNFLVKIEEKYQKDEYSK